MTAPRTFEQVLDAAKAMLAEGAANRSVAAHVPVVGTADGDQRVMVLRSFDAETSTLRFHTDSRSPKVEAINDDPSVHVLIYDRDRKVQLRMAGTGTIQSDGPMADQAWEESTAFARRCYLGEAPTSPSPEPTSGLPCEVEGIAPSEEQLRRARQNFAVLRVKITEIDWFLLDHHGHRRARIDLEDRGRDSWLTP